MWDNAGPHLAEVAGMHLSTGTDTSFPIVAATYWGAFQRRI